MGSIELAQFPKIKFVFANLGDLSAAAGAVQQVKAFMNQARRVYYFAQISKKPRRPSELVQFTPSPVLPSRPAVIDDRAELEEWLNDLDRGYYDAISGMIEPPPGGPGGSGSGGSSGARPSGSGGSGSGGSSGAPSGGSWNRVFVNYRSYDFSTSGVVTSILLGRSLVDIASEVRDTAFEKDLTEDQTKLLARKAVLQEKALGDVRAYLLNNIELKPNEELVLDGLRKPLAELTLEDNYLEETPALDLVTVKLDKPFSLLSKTQSALCSSIGLSAKSHVVLRGETVEKNKELKDFVVRRMNLTLPFNATELLR